LSIVVNGSTATAAVEAFDGTAGQATTAAGELATATAVANGATGHVQATTTVATATGTGHDGTASDGGIAVPRRYHHRRADRTLAHRRFSTT
jgi:hypothetical protein